ncbi:MAG: NRDE family protein [Lautropia sp.]|nr:NRDE family protein [Lautropia sp.]
MCLVALAWQHLPGMPLCLISNRDEFHARPTAGLAPWQLNEAALPPAQQLIIGGRDLQSGGTWLGVTPDGRWAVLTNVRDARDQRRFSTSRGALVTDFLAGDLSPLDYQQWLTTRLDDYAGFNLIVGTPESAVYLGNGGPASRSPELLTAGVHVLCNGQKADPWAKSERIRQRFTHEFLPQAAQTRPESGTIALHEQARRLEQPAWHILEDTLQQPDDQLPDTGLSLDWERLLSSTFIQSEHHGYGTRCSNLLMLSEAGTWDFSEKTQHGPERGLVRRWSNHGP